MPESTFVKIVLLSRKIMPFLNDYFEIEYKQVKGVRHEIA